jgi:hypothetical protein
MQNEGVDNSLTEPKTEAFPRQLRQMWYGDQLSSFRLSHPRRNFMYSMEYVCTIIPIPAHIAYPNRHILQNNKTILMLESLPLYQPGPNHALTVFTLIAIHIAYPSFSVTA